jgi:glycosyltransferase involved in cell wall biosynthesis
MRIGIVHFRLLHNGGLERRLFNYIRVFRAMGHQVEVVVSKVDESIELPADVRLHRINLSAVPKPVRMYFFDRRASQILEKERFDLSLSLGRTGNNDLLICPGTHKGYLKAMAVGFPSPIDLLNIWLDKRAYCTSRIILAASEMMRQEVLGLYNINPEKVKVLLPPIDVARFNAASDEVRSTLREKYLPGFKGKVAAFLSMGAHRKGHAFLLEVFSGLGDEICLLMVGNGPTVNLPPNVRHIGFVDDTAPIHQLADVLVHPAQYEPFGQIVTEALLCGTPALVSDMVGAKSIVGPDMGEVLPVGDVGRWRHAIMKWATSGRRVRETDMLRQHLSTEGHCLEMLRLASISSEPASR